MSEVIGKIIHIGQTETVGSAGTFKKRLVVVATEEQYVQQIPVDFVQAKCDLLDQYKVGESVKISINIRGNEYQGKWYCSLNGWKIEGVSGAPVIPPAANQSAVDAYQANAAQSEQEDDLPF